MNFKKRRIEMVDTLDDEGVISSHEIRNAMLKVPREEFVPRKHRRHAYIDVPIPIPGSVTMSAPHMHAIMMTLLRLKKGDKVLEIGAGSGILMAYMKEVVGPKGKVFGMELIPETYKFAKGNLETTGYSQKVRLIEGDGRKGMPEKEPFDKIVCGAAASEVPRAWVRQLKDGGVIVCPIGSRMGNQTLYYMRKTGGKLRKNKVANVLFVPLKGK